MTVRKAQGARLSATSTRQDSKKVFFTFRTDWLVTSIQWRLELDIENLMQDFTLSFLKKKQLAARASCFFTYYSTSNWTVF
jgi:hypothetical protein